MKTYVSKRKTIKVIGTWTGGEDEVTQWLTGNGYTWKIQTEDPDSLAERITQEREYLASSGEEGTVDTEARVRLVIIGPLLWQQWHLDRGDILTQRHNSHDEVTLGGTSQDDIDRNFDEVV